MAFSVKYKEPKANSQRLIALEQEKSSKQNNKTADSEKIKELEENWKRALADYKNLERRVAEERRDFIKFANMALLLKLFEVYDSLKAGLSHHKEVIGPVYNQLKRVLESEGLKVLKIKEGDDFDPEKMEAVEGSAGEKVGQVAQDGFELDGKVIRPARVELK